MLSLSPHAERLRQAPWTSVVRHAWLLLLACLFLRLALPAGLSSLLKPLPLFAPLLLLAAKDLSHLPDALARSRAALAGRDWHALPLAWLPPELVGLLRLGRAQRQGCIDWLLRRPQPAPPAGQRFSYLERGAYRTVFAIAVFCLLVELPLDAAIVSVLPVDPAKRQLLHLMMLAGGLSALAWVLGDRRLVGAGCHVLDGERLLLRVGARAAGAIARADIVALHTLDAAPADWCRKNGVDMHRTISATPFDTPNAVLVLRPGNGVTLRHLGRERGGLDGVFLYLDRPEALRAALRATG